jgi:hypothetical protein
MRPEGLDPLPDLLALRTAPVDLVEPDALDGLSRLETRLRNAIDQSPCERPCFGNKRVEIGFPMNNLMGRLEPAATCSNGPVCFG